MHGGHGRRARSLAGVPGCSRATGTGYFEKRKHMMAYDEYLDWGLPIATGVVESSCNSLVKNRMEGCGMRWSVDGAEAMLRLRSVYLSDDWQDYWSYHTQAEGRRLHGGVLRMIRRLRKTGDCDISIAYGLNPLATLLLGYAVEGGENVVELCNNCGGIVLD